MKVNEKPLGLVDIHHHIIPDIYREGLMEEGITHSAGRSINKWDIGMSLDFMDHLGIETAFVSITDPALSPIIEKVPEKAKRIAQKTNEFMSDMIRQYPDRFGAFALLPMPDVEASIEVLNYALDVLKLDGVGLLSNYGGEYLGNKKFDQLFEELQKKQAVVYVHPSVPPVEMPRPQFLPIDYMEEFTFNTTRAAANLIFSGTMERFPDIKFIFSHMGGTLPYLRWRLDRTFPYAENYRQALPVTEEVREGWKSVKKSISEYISNMWFDTALSVDVNVLKMVENIAPRHTLFGSDSFYASRKDGEDFITGLKKELSEDGYDNVAYLNVRQLFPYRWKKE